MQDTPAQEALATQFDPDVGAVLSPTLAQAIEQQRAGYRYALKLHDWHFESSYDAHGYNRGVTERNRLEIAARSVDPDYRIWDAIAPAMFRKNIVREPECPKCGATWHGQCHVTGRRAAECPR